MSTPQSVTVITQQRIADQKLSNLTDAMEATSGITVVREGQGADSDAYYSRGFAISNFEINGVPTSSRMDNYTQNTAMYDRVEVVRGATGLISGMGQPSATINLIRKRPTATPQASISGEAGSWDRYGTSVDVSLHCSKPTKPCKAPPPRAWRWNSTANWPRAGTPPAATPTASAPTPMTNASPHKSPATA